LAQKEICLTTNAAGNLKRWRNNLSRFGYALVICSVVLAIALWSRTCALGGFHCFDGGAGYAMAGAQIGVIFGLLCSLFGGGTKRFLFAGIALIELVFCYFQLLVH
jgi:hypothetical protein